MSESAVPAPVPDSADVDGVIQSLRFELYRENIYGALEIVEAAQAARPDPGLLRARRVRLRLRLFRQGLIPARGRAAQARRPQFIGASFRRSDAGDGL